MIIETVIIQFTDAEKLQQLISNEGGLQTNYHKKLAKEGKLEICISKENLQHGGIQIGYHFRGQNHFIDYFFCEEKDVNEIVEHYKELIKVIYN